MFTYKKHSSSVFNKQTMLYIENIVLLKHLQHSNPELFYSLGLQQCNNLIDFHLDRVKSLDHYVNKYDDKELRKSLILYNKKMVAC